MQKTKQKKNFVKSQGKKNSQYTGESNFTPLMYFVFFCLKENYLSSGWLQRASISEDLPPPVMFGCSVRIVFIVPLIS